MKPRRAPVSTRMLLAFLAGIICLASLLSVLLSPAVGSDSPVSGLSREETLRLGERIYRDGILPSGKPLTAVVQGDIPVEGTMFSCVSCHLRSGLGSFEGGVLTPPTNGNVLFQPWNISRETAKLRKGSVEDSAKLVKLSRYYLSRFGEFLSRPAYTDETLADAIREGADPVGRKFLGVMPRYSFGERDMAILIAYLKSLSKDPSPGVTETTIRFATVITEEVSEVERDGMLVPLERFIRSYYTRQLRMAGIRTVPAGEGGVPRIAADLELRQMALARWELKGSPETWREQLEEYYRKEPVFALLGGITTREWRPVHEFSEEHAIPCLFPITDLPFVSPKGWYTLYFSKGYYQEGETAARHLAGTEGPYPESTVVQVYSDTPEGKAFASGFRDAWSESGRGPLVDKTLPAGTQATREYLEQATGKERRAVLVLWMGADAMPALDAAAGKDGGISRVYMSASLLKDGLLTVPETLRDRTYVTYPYGLPRHDTRKMFFPPGGKKAPSEITDRKIAGKVASLSSVLTEIFMVWRSNFYRDYMFDVIDGNMRMVSSPYESISFGPGQRYASKGCFIVQLSKGDPSELVRKSEWVIH